MLISIRNNIIDQIRQHQPESLSIGTMEVHAEYADSDTAQNAYYQVILFDKVEAVCVSNKLSVYWDE